MGSSWLVSRSEHQSEPGGRCGLGTGREHMTHRLGREDGGHRAQLGGSGGSGLLGASLRLAKTELLGSVAPTRISRPLCLRTASPRTWPPPSPPPLPSLVVRWRFPGQSFDGGWDGSQGGGKAFLEGVGTFNLGLT